MKKFEIKINGELHPIAFKYGALKLLGAYLNKEGYDATLAEVGRLFAVMNEAEKSGKSVPWDVTDSMVYMVLAAMHGGNPETDVDFDDVAHAMIEDVDLLATVFICFFEYQPKPKKQDTSEGKPKARSNRAKKRTS